LDKIAAIGEDSQCIPPRGDWTPLRLCLSDPCGIREGFFYRSNWGGWAWDEIRYTEQISRVSSVNCFGKCYCSSQLCSFL